MPLRAKRLLLVATVLLVSIFWPLPRAGQSYPTTAALSAFEALQSAQGAGANITSLVDQYNALLQQSASDSSFANLGQLARSAQQNAVAPRSSAQTLTVVLVPVIAIVLAIVVEGLLQLRRKIERERILEMEVRHS